MKLSIILTLFSLSVMVRGWAAFVSPIVVSVGAMLAALNIDVEPLLNSHSMVLPDDPESILEVEKVTRNE